MMLYELNDILFFVKSFKEPNKTIPNVPYDLTVSAGGGGGTRLLQATNAQSYGYSLVPRLSPKNGLVLSEGGESLGTRLVEYIYILLCAVALTTP